jgi:FSR family fosmidomycin resistance protein-like MFS transporter
MIGIYALALLEIPLFLFMFVAMRHVTVEKHPKLSQSSKKNQPTSQIPWRAILLLALVIGFRSWAFLGTVAFLPKMFQDMGWNATAYGFITTAYWIAAAVMGVLAGAWADRWGRRQVIFVTLMLSTIPLYFLPLNDGAWAFFLAVAAGGLMGASHSILVVIGQDILPSSKSLASGLTLGYLFTIGAIAIWLIGELADVWGLNTIIQLGAGTSLIAALLALLLPTTTVEEGVGEKEG